jgi:hypothetical protein
VPLCELKIRTKTQRGKTDDLKNWWFNKVLHKNNVMGAKFLLGYAAFGEF